MFAYVGVAWNISDQMTVNLKRPRMLGLGPCLVLLALALALSSCHETKAKTMTKYVTFIVYSVIYELNIEVVDLHSELTLLLLLLLLYWNISV